MDVRVVAQLERRPQRRRHVQRLTLGFRTNGRAAVGLRRGSRTGTTAEPVHVIAVHVHAERVVTKMVVKVPRPRIPHVLAALAPADRGAILRTRGRILVRETLRLEEPVHVQARASRTMFMFSIEVLVQRLVAAVVDQALHHRECTTSGGPHSRAWMPPVIMAAGLGVPGHQRVRLPGLETVIRPDGPSAPMLTCLTCVPVHDGLRRHQVLRARVQSSSRGGNPATGV
jgi:hypothetical protein